MAIARPHAMLDLAGDASLREVADEAEARLERVLASL